MERVLRVCVQIVPFTFCVNNEQIVSEGSALMQARASPGGALTRTKKGHGIEHAMRHAPCAMRGARCEGFCHCVFTSL